MGFVRGVDRLGKGAGIGQAESPDSARCTLQRMGDVFPRLGIVGIKNAAKLQDELRRLLVEQAQHFRIQCFIAARVTGKMREIDQRLLHFSDHSPRRE